MAKKVLVVEDNELNLKLFCDLLRAHGWIAEPVRDGREAVARARDFRPDLIVMDMQMPDLDGLAATCQIRQLPGYAATPILAMTANAFAEDKARCFEAGMNDFITKPVNPFFLFSTLLKWLSGPARISR